MSLGGAASSSDLYTLDTTTGAVTSRGPMGVAFTGLACDPTTNIVYGVTSESSGGGASKRRLYTVNTATGAVTLVGSLGTAYPLTDICFDSAGILYGWPSGL